MLNLRILTFNIWTLPIRLPAEDRNKRVALIPSALAASDADIIFFQEAFDLGARRTIIGVLKDRYYVNDRALEERRVLGLLKIDCTGGLMILSKMPIIRSHFTPHLLPRAAKRSERLGEKGFLRSTILTPIGELEVFNIHLYAGRKEQDTSIRMSQLAAFSQELDNLKTLLPVIVAGDLNASPYVYLEEDTGRTRVESSEYAFLSRMGLEDTLEVNGSEGISAITYSVSTNKYAAAWYNESKVDQRFDYIFYRESQEYGIRVGNASVVFDDRNQPLSDHYGVLSEVIIHSNSIG